MRYLRRAWTTLCVATLALAFVRLPAWDLSVDDSGWDAEWFSGTEVFIGLLFVLAIVWLLGLGVLALVGEALGARRRIRVRGADGE